MKLNLSLDKMNSVKGVERRMVKAGIDLQRPYYAKQRGTFYEISQGEK